MEERAYCANKLHLDQLIQQQQQQQQQQQPWGAGGVTTPASGLLNSAGSSQSTISCFSAEIHNSHSTHHSNQQQHQQHQQRMQTHQQQLPVLPSLGTMVGNRPALQPPPLLPPAHTTPITTVPAIAPSASAIQSRMSLRNLMSNTSDPPQAWQHSQPTTIATQAMSESSMRPDWQVPSIVISPPAPVAAIHVPPPPPLPPQQSLSGIMETHDHHSQMNASMQGYHHYHQQQQHQQHQHQHQQHQQQQHQQHGLNGPVYQPQHQQSLYNHYQPPPQNDYQAHAYSSTPHLHPQQHISPHQHQHGYPHPHPHSRPHPHPHPHQHLQQYQSCISEDENVSPYPHLQPPALSQSSPAAVGSPPQPTAVPSNFATASAINIKAKAPRNPTPSACANCKRTHLACDSSRPCKRCVARNETSTCIDLPPKKRGRPTAAQKNARAILPEQAATTLVTASAAASARTPDAAAMSTQTKADMDIDETVTSAASALMVIKKRPNEMTSPQLAPNQANESTSKDIKRPRYDVPITPRPDSAMQISSPLLSSPPPPQPASSLPPLPQQVAVVESSSTSVPATQAFLDDGSNFEPVRIIADLNGVCVVVPDSTAHFLGIRPADLLFTKFSTSVTPNDQGSVDNLLFFVGANNTRVRLMERGLLPRNAPPQMTAVTNRPAMTSRLNLSSLMPSLPKRIGGPSIGGSGGGGGIPPPKLAKPQDRDSVPARDPREVSNLLHTLPNETLFKTPNLMSGETVVDIRRHGSFSKAKASFGHVAYSTKSSSTKGEDILDCIVIMISPVSSTSSPPIAGVPTQQVVAL